MKALSKTDLLILEELAIRESRVSFNAFRRYMHPQMKTGWFTNDLGIHLQEFYEDYVNHRKPVLGITAPPQHGKSTAIVDFIAWMFGKTKDKRIIYSAFSQRLGIRANLQLQRLITSPRYSKVFPKVRIGAKGDSNDFGATRNRELIEIINSEASFRNTTVRGSITGESLDLGIIDDPIKGREAANSETVRESTWNWMTDDFLTRFSEFAGLLFIMTRWHVDDPLGRFQQTGQIKIVKYEAIASQDEDHRKEGEALFPELKSLEFLTKKKEIMLPSSWQSLYQQNPRIVEGELIKRSWFVGKRYKTLPTEGIKLVQSWDTAQKASELNDYTVCTTWIEVHGKHYLVNVRRFKAEYPELKRTVVSMYHSALIIPSAVLIEDKSSGQSLIQDLRNSLETLMIPVIAINPTQDKITRMAICSDTMEAGLVYLPEESDWLADYEDELFSFPRSKRADQVDSTSQYLGWVKTDLPILIG